MKSVNSTTKVRASVLSVVAPCCRRGDFPLAVVNDSNKLMLQEILFLCERVHLRSSTSCQNDFTAVLARQVNALHTIWKIGRPQIYLRKKSECPAHEMAIR